MNDKDLQQSLKRALSQAPELDFSKLINTPVTRMTEHDSITEQHRKPDSRQKLSTDSQPRLADDD